MESTSKVTPLREGDAHYRTPPHNVEAEQALLGAMLVNNQAYHRVAEFLAAEHFAEAVHGRIYGAIGTLIERGQVANPVTLKNLFDQDGSLAGMGGAQYLVRLAASAVTIINAEHYGRAILDLHLRRELITIGEDVVNDAHEHDLEKSAHEQIEATEQRLFNLATSRQPEAGFRPFKTALTEAVTMAESAFKRSGRTAGVATGFRDLDERLGGLHPSDLVILAGRPGMGKTALATNIAFHVARHYRAAAGPETSPRAEDGGVVAFFSLEMSAEQLATRILAEESGVPSDRIRRGDVSNADFENFVSASTELAQIPLYIDDTPALKISAVRTRARRLMRTRALHLIVIDYLQLLHATGQGTSVENRVQEISEITRGLKTLAKELNVPVLALSQLSRAVEQRDDKRPQLADLRESGTIEQDADVVMFVFREEYYLQRQQPVQGAEEKNERYNDRIDQWKKNCERAYGLAEVIIAKQRHGPTGTIKLHFEGRTTKFTDFVSRDSLPDDM
jgi:replicative DNA helicase